MKANLGHLEAAAGIAGLIKATLVLQHRVAPPCTGLRRLNPLIAPVAKAFELPLTAMPLAIDARHAGVSSFGFGGTNAHVVLRAPEPVPKAELAAPDGAVALCLSARDAAALKMLAHRWSSSLHAHRDVPASVWAANALRRRTAMRARLVVIGDNPAALAERIDRWLAGERSAAITEADDPALTNIAGLAGDTARAWLGGERPDWRNAWTDAPLPLARCRLIRSARTLLGRGCDTRRHATRAGCRPRHAELGLRRRNSDANSRAAARARPRQDRPQRETDRDRCGFIVLARALREIERSFSVTLSFRQILEQTPTIAGLAGHLAATVPRFSEPMSGAPFVPHNGEAEVDRLFAETERTLAVLIAQQNWLRQLLVPAYMTPADLASNVIKIPTPPVVSPKPSVATERRSLDDGAPSSWSARATLCPAHGRFEAASRIVARCLGRRARGRRVPAIGQRDALSHRR